MKPVVVRRESRIGAHRALVDQDEAARFVVGDERVVVTPGVQAETLAPERCGSRERPGDDRVDEPATRIRRGAREAVEIDVRTALELTPDRGILVRDGKDAD